MLVFVVIISSVLCLLDVFGLWLFCRDVWGVCELFSAVETSPALSHLTILVMLCLLSGVDVAAYFILTTITVEVKLEISLSPTICYRPHLACPI